MTLAAVVSPYQPIVGLTGIGLNQGFLYIGLDGQDPEVSPQNCYWDDAGSVIAAQPISVVGGYPMRLGSPARIYTASSYSIRVRDRSGSQVFYEAHAVPGAGDAIALLAAVGTFPTLSAAQAASIAAPIRTTGVTLQGRTAAGDGGKALYRYSASMPSHLGRFQSADGAWWEIAEPVLSLPMFGTDLTAWQAGVSVMNAGISDTLVIPPGVWSINRVGLGSPLTTGLITITNNGSILFEPGSLVQFDYLDLPLFCFSGCTRGGLFGAPRLRFTGATPTGSPFTRAQYSTASGFSFASWIGGGNYEMQSVVLSNSSGVRFENVDLESTTLGSEAHAIPFAFNLKPPGLAQWSSDIWITNARLRDVNYGVLGVQLDGLQVHNLDVDRRVGITPSGQGPGHALYMSGLGTGTPNKNCVVNGLRDGPNPVNWPASVALNLGTLAAKDCQFCEFINVRSYHPAGILHSIQQANDCDFLDWSWRTTDSTVVGTAAVNCVLINQRNRFGRFDIYAPGKLFLFGQNGSGTFDDNEVFDFYIASKLDLGVGAPPQGVFDINGARNDFRNIRINPQGGITGTTQCGFATRGGGGVSFNNTFDCTFARTGTPAMRRMADSGANNWARFALDTRATDQNYLNNDQLTLPTTTGSFVETGTQASRAWESDSGGTGLETRSYILPGRGSFLLFVDVASGDHSSRIGGVYHITFANQGTPLHNAQVVGAPFVIGTGISGLTVSCNENGGVFVQYTKGSAFFAFVSFSSLRIGAIAD